MEIIKFPCNILDNLKLARFELILVAGDELYLPMYLGSTLRGGFGTAFKRVVCALRDRLCHECILKEKCVYSYVFETPPPANTTVMRKYESSPHPFVIEPPLSEVLPLENHQRYKTGDTLTLNLILIGRAIDYLPYFIYTFDEFGRIGIGKGRGRFELQDVSCEGKIIYDSRSKILASPLEPLTLNLKSTIQNLKSPNTLTLNFLTPCRIVYNGYLTKDLEFHIFVRNLIRRIALLSYFHCGCDTSEIDFKGIIEQASQIRVGTHLLQWYDWERYSARQETRMKMGGFVGKITFEGNIEPFMPLIQAGEVLHVGKGTSFGLGRYEIG
ncbi:CRISPR system precrRNA processing endoribonuclease RAMP protein Cas6 [Candidatus Desantisbacteria bacterium]|nr:CRISPR system precrRNA processing endoribonuclease RAMP protein Cas6 [Candidatus Desantisbacteria bacterium]